MLSGRSRILPVVLYIVVVFLVSSIPSLRAPGPSFLLKDKVAHLLEYTILGLLLVRAIQPPLGKSLIVTLAFIVAVGATVGALDEIYQSFIPGREMDIGDWGADVLGVTLGATGFVLAAGLAKTERS